MIEQYPMLVTVYITNFNYGNFIQQAIDSVLQQTLQDFEIIIIDDGSTDHSKEIIEEYATHPQIRTIFQKNKGLNVTNNIALRVANGKYIMRLDADDFLDTNALLVMSNMLESNPELGLVFPNYYLTDAEGRVDSVHQRHDFENDVSLMDQAAHGACTMIRTQFLKELGGYNENYQCQDGYELWVKFTAKHRVANVATPLFYYRQHGSNLTKNETRILTTRASINQEYVKDHEERQQAVAIIPIRDKGTTNNKLALTYLGDQTVLEHKIASVLQAKNVQRIVVTSPDEAIRTLVEKQYGENNKVLFVSRPKEQAQLNVGLVETVSHLLEDNKLADVTIASIIILAIEYPFVSATTIDDAVNTMYLFDSDSLISVRPDTSLFFQHEGHGMQPILNQEKFTKLEREALYKYTGGISVTRASAFHQHRQFITGTVGHIIVDQKTSLGIFSEYDLNLAKLIAQSDL
uniref:Glycosyltransferase family 2 protein n=1 Tax=Roseihalotalea indica TaxID=2867963 RepID=A0AA49GK77_9BACT|nr:glycosyltransferase family 2 protein [Tunicatimonas sp. TK19036]